MSDQLEILIRRWTRLGAGFSVEPAAPDEATPDLERLLLDTARHGPEMARLFIMGVTWLRAYGSLVARQRLVRLIREELEGPSRAVLGLLLDLAQEGQRPALFRTIVRELKPPPLPLPGPPRPLFESERATPELAARAERRASGTSRRWGLWCAPIELKADALRPPSWVIGRNAGFLTRADLRGDLRASVLASLSFDPGAGESEVSLARATGGSRAQVRNALEMLELTGRVRRERGRRRRNGIVLAEAA